MILIADSGSSKTEWTLTNHKKERRKFQTIGLNPYYLNYQSIVDVLKKEYFFSDNEKKIDKVFFYGAGCLYAEKKKIITDALLCVFSEATVYVDVDLMGASLALCGNQRGIVCILGTGANCCFYDGKKIINHFPSLGFILGDEGSGAYIGKKIVSAFLNQDMPDELQQLFKNKYPIKREEYLNNIYSKQQPNKFLASFCFFAKENISHPYIVKLLKESFKEFFLHYVCRYPEHSSHQIHFTGSVAFEFADMIKEIAISMNMITGKIVQHPIDALTEYHLAMSNETFF